MKGQGTTSYERLFVLNVQRQIEKLKKKTQINSYFEFPYPEFDGQVVITSADNNLERGQFRRVKVSSNYLDFELKVPTAKGWEWINVRKLLPDID